MLALSSFLALSHQSFAHEKGQKGPHAIDHAPIGVMADHRHKKGEWMLSYRFMHMDMDGNRNGTTSLTPTQIATTVPNRFFGQPMQPPTLRVVPTKMPMNMHMIGGMYGLSDRVTLMAMTNILDIEMDHLTFMGDMGSTIRGAFTTNTSGLGDSRIAAIIGLDDGSNALSQGKIKGIDPAIIAPVQTANPDNHGGEQVQALFGVNLAGQSGALKGHRLAIEYGLPLYRDMNGPQLETDSVLTLGWQKAF